MMTERDDDDDMSGYRSMMSCHARATDDMCQRRCMTMMLVSTAMIDGMYDDDDDDDVYAMYDVGRWSTMTMVDGR